MRSSAALTVFSACALALLLGGVLGDYTLNPAGAVPLAVLLLFQQLVAAQAFRHGTGSIGALQLPSAMQVWLNRARRTCRSWWSSIAISHHLAQRVPDFHLSCPVPGSQSSHIKKQSMLPACMK